MAHTFVPRGNSSPHTDKKAVATFPDGDDGPPNFGWDELRARQVQTDKPSNPAPIK